MVKWSCGGYRLKMESWPSKGHWRLFLWFRCAIRSAKTSSRNWDTLSRNYENATLLIRLLVPHALPVSQTCPCGGIFAPIERVFRFGTRARVWQNFLLFLLVSKIIILCVSDYFWVFSLFLFFFPLLFQGKLVIAAFLFRIFVFSFKSLKFDIVYF